MIYGEIDVMNCFCFFCILVCCNAVVFVDAKSDMFFFLERIHVESGS